MPPRCLASAGRLPPNRPKRRTSGGNAERLVASTARQCFATKETRMFRLAELGIAKRLGLLVLGGVIALVALAVIAVTGQHSLDRQGDAVRRLEVGLAAIKHLDTRPRELKADAYRAGL